MKPTIVNLFFAFSIIFILRYVVLQFFPTMIINGYFSIFLCFCLVSYIFTNNMSFSIIMGLLVVFLRIIYRNIKNNKTLHDYNSLGNCVIFTIVMLILGIILFNFEKIHRESNKYYDHIIAVQILTILYSLKINKNDSQLICFA